VHKIQVRNLFAAPSILSFCFSLEKGEKHWGVGTLLVVNLHILHINKTDFVASEASAEMSQHKMAKEAPNKYKIK